MEQNDTKSIENIKYYIIGAFIICKPVLKERIIEEIQYIKLSLINVIYPGYENKDCFFNTYKDRMYYVRISHHALGRAIDSFIFNPQDHWKTYGYE